MVFGKRTRIHGVVVEQVGAVSGEDEVLACS